MNFTADIATIAMIELYSHLERQVQEIAPEGLFIAGGNRGATAASPIRVRTPQRRANYRNRRKTLCVYARDIRRVATILSPLMLGVAQR